MLSILQIFWFLLSGYEQFWAMFKAGLQRIHKDIDIYKHEDEELLTIVSGPGGEPRIWAWRPD